eukprot:evm.model.scf_1373.4 EVM.evm.TU.scf_1373.4   scf_1373:35393-35752(-)
MFDSIAAHCASAADRHEALIEAARRTVRSAGASLASGLVDLATRDAAEAYGAQRAVEREGRAVAAEAERFVAQGRQWAAAVGRIEASLREMGDVENLLEVLAGLAADVQERLGPEGEGA